MTIGDRIRNIRDLANLSQDAFANSIGIKRSTIAQIESGNQLPTIKILLEIVRKYNTTYDYLIDGKGEAQINNTELRVNKDIRQKKENILLLNDPLKTFNSENFDITSIPIIDVSSAAGHGFINSDNPELLGEVKLPSNMLLKRYGNYYCGRVSGESMSPTLLNKDHIIFRLLSFNEWENIKDNNVYFIVDRSGYSYIKRVVNRFNIDQTLLCTSDNVDKNSFRDFSLKADEIANIYHVEWRFSNDMSNFNNSLDIRLSNVENKLNQLLNKL